MVPLMKQVTSKGFDHSQSVHEYHAITITDTPVPLGSLISFHLIYPSDMFIPLLLVLVLRDVRLVSLEKRQKDVFEIDPVFSN